MKLARSIILSAIIAGNLGTGVFVLTGCDSSRSAASPERTSDSPQVWTDPDTGVEYLTHWGDGPRTITPRLNADGKPRTIKAER